MKRWLKWAIIGVLVIAVGAGGTFTWFELTKSNPASFAKLSETVKIDQEAVDKYRAELKAKAEAAAAKAKGGKHVTYSVAVKGNPSSNLDQFRALAAATFNDPRGWARAGVTFQEVASGGNFTLWLSEPGLVPSFNPSICSTVYSCRIGRNVIINDARWAGASDSWNAAGGSLRDYQHMVINHEVGHYLGHDDNERVCASPGQLAPLMQQQSINLRGCKFNPWPLDVELWVR